MGGEKSRSEGGFSTKPSSNVGAVEINGLNKANIGTFVSNGLFDDIGVHV